MLITRPGQVFVAPILRSSMSEDQKSHGMFEESHTDSEKRSQTGSQVEDSLLIGT